MPAAGDFARASDVGEDWLDYSATLTGSTSGGTIGNGTLVARYFVQGDMVRVLVDLTWGSTTSAGVGTALVSLPVTARATSPAHIGTGFLIDSPSGRYPGCGIEMNSTTSVLIVSAAGNGAATAAGTIVTATAPLTWTTGDSWRLEFCYEKA